jgi:hypothetical protein
LAIDELFAAVGPVSKRLATRLLARPDPLPNLNLCGHVRFLHREDGQTDYDGGALSKYKPVIVAASELMVAGSSCRCDVGDG